MLSYSKGPELPLRHEMVYEAFAVAATRFPERTALISGPDKIRWTYHELQSEVDRTAHGLARLGSHDGARVAIWAASCPEWILLQLACPRLGIVQDECVESIPGSYLIPKSLADDLGGEAKRQHGFCY